MASLQDEETANALRALLVQGIARAAVRLNLATPEMAESAKISPQNNQITNRRFEDARDHGGWFPLPRQGEG